MSTETFDLAIRGGTVVDGTGASPEFDDRLFVRCIPPFGTPRPNRCQCSING